MGCGPAISSRMVGLSICLVMCARQGLLGGKMKLEEMGDQKLDGAMNYS